MASKTQNAKDAQGYKKKPQQCNNCSSYKSEMVDADGWAGPHIVEKNKRCGVGGFAVQSSASCNLYCAKSANAIIQGS